MADSADAPSPGSLPPGSDPAPAAGTAAAGTKSPRLDPEAFWDRDDLPAALQANVTDADLAQLLVWAHEFDGTRQPAGKGASAETEANRQQQSRRRHKFRRFDPEAAETSETAAEPAKDVPAGETALAGTAGDDLADGAGARAGWGRQRINRRGALGQPRFQPPSLLSSLVVQFLILAFLVAGFLLGRATLSAKAAAAARRSVPLPADSDKEPALLSASEMALIDQAIAAENAGDTKKAFTIFDQLRHGKGHVAGLDYQLASLAFRSKDAASALMLVNRSIAQNEAVSDCYALRGLIMNSRGVLKGLHDFQAAAQVDPFGAKSFLFWGEALRRAGRPQEALVHLREAVARAQNPWDQAMDELKVRLTQIEIGQGKDFAAALEAEMALPSPPVPWLLTAVAQELHDGDFPAAARNLERARPLLGAALMAGTLRDYFFMAYADKPALATVYAEILGRPAPTQSPPPSSGEDSPPAVIQMPLPPPAAPVAPVPAH
jgi:tetratricopeptide (TPR) repeat protein